MLNRRSICKFFLVIVSSLFVFNVGTLSLSAMPLPMSYTAATDIAIGVVLPSQDQERWVQDGIRFDAALGNAGYTYQILFSQNDPVVEKTNVETLISQGMQVLILCPVDSTAAAVVVEEARAAGVEVISHDRLVRNSTAVDYYVTFDSVAVGVQQAQHLVEQTIGTGNPLYLYAGAASDNNAFLFFEGSWQVLQPKIADGTFMIKNSSEAVALQNHVTLTRDEQVRIINQITTNWDLTTAQNLAQANLAAVAAADKGNVFILGPSDGTARAIADVFAADADVSSYVITGQDAAKDSVQYIIDGKQSMTVFKDIRTLVQDATNAAVGLIEGDEPTPNGSYNNGMIDVPALQSEVISVDKDNIKIRLIDSGYYQLSDFTWPIIPSTVFGSGGVLTSTFDSTTYLFPAESFTSTVLVTHTTIFSSSPSSDLEGVGHSFDIAAVYSDTGLPAQPVKPYTITIQYTDEQKGAVNESTLAFYYWDGSQWIKEPTSTVAVGSNTVMAAPDHFSAWIVMGEIRRVYLPLVVRRR